MSETQPWQQVAEDMAMLVQILWARYPVMMSPGQLGAFIDSLPDDLQYALMADTNTTTWDDGKRYGLRVAHKIASAAPTVDAPQPLTRDGVLAAVARIEAAGDTAVVEVLHTFTGKWLQTNALDWWNPDVHRWNVRVRAVEVETETVPLTQLVGRTIKGETEAVTYEPTHHTGRWWWQGAGGSWRVFPDGTLDLATGLVTVVKGEA